MIGRPDRTIRDACGAAARLIRRAAGLLLLASTFLLPFGATAPVRGYSSGPPYGFTNAPGETTCVLCPNAYALNSGTAQFSISAPLQVVPNSVNTIHLGFTNST